MKPRIALKFECSTPCADMREQIHALRDAWVAEYTKIPTEFPQKKEVCEELILRIHRAAELLAERTLAKGDASASQGKAEGREKEENASLDGDFPLGNEEDMAFASPYFSIGELALIQAGCAESVSPDDIPEEKDVRKGFLKELAGALAEARQAYISYACHRPRTPAIEAVDHRFMHLGDKAYLAKEYEKLLAYAAETKQSYKGLNSIRYDLSGSFSIFREKAEATHEEELLRKYKEKMVECYQNALESNYARIQAHKERGVADFSETDSWTLTLDEGGNPVKTTVIGVGIYGEPVFADNCKENYFGRRRTDIATSCADLDGKIQYNDNLYVLLAEALQLKSGAPLGAAPSLTPNYDLDGLVGGQLDAAAWQNYAIEHGLVHPVNYDASLRHLIAELQELIALYEQALRMV